MIPPAITEGADSVTSTEGDDNFKLLGGNEVFDGISGNDTVGGGLGDDTLTGGAGADVFVFHLGSHRDTITDLELGIDQIDFSEDAFVEELADLLITQNGAHTQITTGGPVVITLLDTDSLLLDVNDFIF